MIKKQLWLILIVVMFVSLAACDGEMVLDYPDQNSNEPITEQDNDSQESNNDEQTENEPAPDQQIEGTLNRVVDGDTYVVTIENLEQYGYSQDVVRDDDQYRVRAISVDTPEICSGNESSCEPEPYGPEATEYVSSQVSQGDTVYLEQDVSETDPYGRLLFYVYLEDGRSLQKALLSEGLAEVAVYEPDTSKVDTYQSIEEEAKAEEVGLWSE